MEEGGVVKLGARDVGDAVGVVACEWFSEAGGVFSVEDKAGVGGLELLLCSTVVDVWASLAVVGGLVDGTGVRGGATGGGG